MTRIIKAALAALLLLTASARAADVRYDPGTTGYVAAPFNLFATSDLSGLGSGACVTSTASVFSQASTQNGSTTGGAVFARLVFQPAGAFTPVTGQTLSVWLLNYEPAAASYESTFACSTTQPPVARAPDFIIPLVASALSSTSQVWSATGQIPMSNYKAVVWNGGTGGAVTAFSANNHKLLLAPFMTQQ